MNISNINNNLTKNTHQEVDLFQKLEPLYDHAYFAFTHREVKIINALSGKEDFDLFIKEYALRLIYKRSYKVFLNRYVKDIPGEYQLELCYAMEQDGYYAAESVNVFFVKLQKKLLSEIVAENVSVKTKKSVRL